MTGGDDDFERAMRDVAKLGDRDKLRPDPAPAPPRIRSEDDAPAFVLEQEGDRVFARRPDLARRTLADLRAGRTPVDAELDLHGLDAAAARRALEDGLRRAHEDGARCLLVIHGAGHHSETDAVLRSSLPGWLQQGREAHRLLAFASAPREQGGAGATLVLLRRAR